MVSGLTPSSAENASVFAQTEGTSGPAKLAARARALGFVAGNMFGAASTNGGHDDTRQDDRALHALRRTSSAPEVVPGNGTAGLSFIGSLGASIPRHEFYTPSADRASYHNSSSASDKASQQFQAGLRIPSMHASTASSLKLGSRPPAHTPFPQGLLLPSTAAAPHVSLHTLAERERDIMGRWSGTMAAAAEMQLRRA